MLHSIYHHSHFPLWFLRLLAQKLLLLIYGQVDFFLLFLTTPMIVIIKEAFHFVHLFTPDTCDVSGVILGYYLFIDTILIF